MPKRSPEEYAKVAYQAYGDQVGWRNYAGLPMPAWDDLGDRIQQAWAAACTAVVDDLLTPPGYDTRAGTASSFGRQATVAGAPAGDGAMHEQESGRAEPA